MLGNKVEYLSFNEVTTFTINDRTYAVDTSVAPYYFVALNAVDGLYGADISYESHPIPNAIGEKSGDVFRRGKTITLSGKIYGHSLGALHQGALYLQQMFAETTLRKLRFYYMGDPIQVYLRCRVSQDLAIVEQIEKFNPVFSWTVGLRTDDPRTYKTSDNSLYPSWQA